MRLLRVAVNAEQLLYRSPGGIGRYTAQLLTVLPGGFADLEMVPFVARHSLMAADAVLAAVGVEEQTRRRLARQPLPRPLLYEAWLRVGRPGLRGLGAVDVVHAPSVAVPPRGRAPLVVTVHDAAPELFPEAFPRRGRKFHAMGLAAAARRADLVITVSHAAADEITRLTAIEPARLRVVPNGVRPHSVDPAAAKRVLAARGLADQRYVLWVGSSEPRKGIGTLVAAMAELRKKGAHPDVRTVLAGYDGWLGAGLIDRDDLDALGPSLLQLGRVGEDELWSLYAGATAFAFPSLHEGFGLPVVEAMSRGVPVVASDIPALREVTAGAARLAPAGMAAAWAAELDGLLSDESARQALGAEGAERSRWFSVERMTASTLAVYQEVGS